MSQGPSRRQWLLGMAAGLLGAVAAGAGASPPPAGAAPPGFAATAGRLTVSTYLGGSARVVGPTHSTTFPGGADAPPAA